MTERYARFLQVVEMGRFHTNRATHGDAYAQAQYFLGSEMLDSFKRARGIHTTLADKARSIVLHDRALTGYPRGIL